MIWYAFNGKKQEAVLLLVLLAYDGPMYFPFFWKTAKVVINFY